MDELLYQELLRLREAQREHLSLLRRLRHELPEACIQLSSEETREAGIDRLNRLRSHIGR